MDCFAFCTTSSYNVKPLFNSMHGECKASLHRGVLHVELPLEDGEGSVGDLFLFPYGAVVTWDIPREIALRFLKEIKEFEDTPLAETEIEEYSYTFGETPSMRDDFIILPYNDTITKQAFSHGLAQSIKLNAFETRMRHTFESTKKLPENLAKQGNIPLSRREIRRKIGELFIERSSINLHVDVLDTPEFFWEYPEYEPIYTITANELEIDSRTTALNQQLDVIRDLFEMLGNELNHQHSSRLEWAIIWLIIIEVVLLLMHDVFKII